MSEWNVIRASAHDHPNVVEGREVIPGGPSRAWIEDVKADYGEDSPYYVARVEARFPEQASDALFERSWLDTARTDDRREALEEPAQFEPVVLGVDPARQGPDATAVSIRQGPILRDVRTWHEDSLEDSADRVVRLLNELTGERKPRVKEVVVDSIGIGAGLADGLRRRLEGRIFPYQEVTLEYNAIYRRTNGGKIQVRDFNSGSNAGDAERFENLRAEAFWNLRDRLEAGEFALPDDPELREELLAMRWEVTPSGKVKLPRKEQLKSRLGRSPDRADSLAMSFLPELDVGGPEFWFA